MGGSGLAAIGVALLLSTTFPSTPAFAADKIEIGVTAILEGTCTRARGGRHPIRGLQTALNVFGKNVGDNELEFVIASTDATPDSAVRAVRKLVERDKVQIPAVERISMKNVAKTHPELSVVTNADTVLKALG